MLGRLSNSAATACLCVCSTCRILGVRLIGQCDQVVIDNPSRTSEAWMGQVPKGTKAWGKKSMFEIKVVVSWVSPYCQFVEIESEKNTFFSWLLVFCSKLCLLESLRLT